MAFRAMLSHESTLEPDYRARLTLSLQASNVISTNLDRAQPHELFPRIGGRYQACVRLSKLGLSVAWQPHLNYEHQHHPNMSSVWTPQSRIVQLFAENQSKSQGKRSQNSFEHGAVSTTTGTGLPKGFSKHYLRGELPEMFYAVRRSRQAYHTLSLWRYAWTTRLTLFLTGRLTSTSISSKTATAPPLNPIRVKRQ
ncbi:hypothetical protein BD324DRAFT_447112 [Kockovaella imperatae]|uniref:Uncharacterized protein n=1 Tax=Kockovaella imperatae TaxID=4999 RepID=A0A1Y1UH88_9TREE|nr:hypothetical protein BD324DRAFT_447112 [Kockovaella imperatae]ORX37392.1 hypothetical protein BD324DRAFT_447112 [Kockovaella imperatae]